MDGLYQKIITDDSMQETLNRGDNSFGFYFYNETIEQFICSCVDWHWHDEFEVVYIESGSVDFHIGMDKFCLSKGNAILINSRAMHKLSSDISASIPNFLFSPELISLDNSHLFNKYVFPVINSTSDYIIFNSDSPSDKYCLELIKEIISNEAKKTPSELMSLSKLFSMWSSFLDNHSFTPRSVDAFSSQSSTIRIQLMIQYIQANYRSLITLDDIAASANISKSSALKLFKAYMDSSPVNYLIEFRLNMAAKLLRKDDSKISVISQECGFDNIGYFCRQFKKKFNVTPTEFRRNSVV